MDSAFARHISSPSAASAASNSSRPITRPPWPSLIHTHARSASSIASVTASPATAAHWDASSSTSTNTWTNGFRQPAASAQTPLTGAQVEDTIRQWNFTAFEWTVQDVHALRDFVERGQLATATEGCEALHEVLRESPMLGDSKLKLEIVRTSIQELQPINATPTSSSPSHGDSVPPTHQIPTLSLCVTSLIFDNSQGPEYDVTMMAAVKAQYDRGPECGARADWVWVFWETNWSFRQDSEVWECTLPSLSTLLENPRIAETDSFVICIQIHSPVGSQFPQHPFAVFAPRDLLDGIEASLDNPHTGDVKFVCLERLSQSSGPASPLMPTTPSSRHSSLEASSATHSTARKRIIYAHSDILIRRSDYFHAMLTSAFSENVNVPSGDRKVYEIIVEEADFITIYWLLKYCYADWVSFKDHDDPRVAVHRIGEGWSTRWLSDRNGGEWDWKTFSKPGICDDTSAGSREDDSNDKGGHSVGSSVTGRTTRSFSHGKRSSRSPSGGQRVSIPSSSGPSSPSRLSSRLTVATRTSASGQPTASSHGPPTPKSSTSAPRQSSTPTTRAPPPSGSGYTFPASPRQPRHNLTSQLQHHSTPDPHPHPTPLPPPASALSIWLVAHRYAMPGLATLAMNHMMSTVQPSTAFSLLLATSRWEELRAPIEDYLMEQWDLACNSEEFEQCCQEVAAGEWGSEGGRTFAGLFRRLRSR